MPTYEYACTECGHTFETVQSFSDDAITECPECHGALRKVYGAVGIVFKGSGFYKTDARGTSSAATPASSSNDPPPSTPSGDGSPSSDGSSSSAPASSPPASSPSKSAAPATSSPTSD